MMRIHNNAFILVVIYIGIVTTYPAGGKENVKKSALPLPKDYSNVVPNLVGGIDRELNLDNSDKGKIQNQPKNSDLPPLEASKKPSQFQSGAIYPPGEEMVFIGEPSYFVSNEPISEDGATEVQEVTPQSPTTNVKSSTQEDTTHENK